MTAVELLLVEDEARFGGKATSLGRALRAGLPVPAGVAIAWPEVDAVASGDSATCRLVKESARSLGGAVAVRSSGVGEDGESASFAGQHVSRLGVAEGGVLEAVVEVWRSGRSPAALSYRKKLGLDETPRVAVVLQTMVCADVAGVLFTRDPVTGRDEIVIEACYGLGEAVVQGLVEPDRYRIDVLGRVLEREPGNKDLAIVACEAGVEERAIDRAKRSALCLGDVELRALAELVKQVVKCFGEGPHDLEWAFAGGALSLLQRRAVTRNMRSQ